ncbi:FecR domain-containing protein [Arcicella sp. LKC2W]|uniref:FecR family protein n=1 Tax=Arcicella sp. LKC2W TaxID=2984198 RepID=UPI002B20D88C|nr:FecR domain-containing protein [Arcicella sp. LKC2W]MEA5460388.1 FecR domain-containing protein [Arcicella sp. LKC2W]
MNTNITKELLFNHFARKTSPLQRQLINDWLKEEKNEELYYQWLEQWEHHNLQYLPDTEESLNQFIGFMEIGQETAILTSPFNSDNENRHSQRWYKWAVAASIFLCLGLLTFVFRNHLYYQTYRTQIGESQAINLPDGSKAVLNENSTLRLARWGFGSENREVFLTGEASFSVKHTLDNQQFIVKSENHFEVVVLGTEFSVYARQQGSKVVLKKGKVRIEYTEGNTKKQLIMKPGELVSLDNQNHIHKKVALIKPQNVETKDNRFVFEETTLQEVGYLLEENYGLTVEIKGDELSQRVLMGSFRAENVDELLKTISELLNINVVRQGNQVILSEY